MGQIKDALVSLLPLSREQKALKVFYLTNCVYAVKPDYHIPPTVSDYRRQIEPQTGLSQQVLLAKAICDLNKPDGILVMATKKAGGNQPFASFFECSIEGKTSKLIILGVCLNLDARIEHLGGDEFRVSQADSLSVADALVEAEVAIDSRSKRGEDKIILRRNQVDKPIREFLEPSGRVIS